MLTKSAGILTGANLLAGGVMPVRHIVAMSHSVSNTYAVTNMGNYPAKYGRRAQRRRHSGEHGPTRVAVAHCLQDLRAHDARQNE